MIVEDDITEIDGMIDRICGNCELNNENDCPHWDNAIECEHVNEKNDPNNHYTIEEWIPYLYDSDIKDIINRGIRPYIWDSIVRMDKESITLIGENWNEQMQERIITILCTKCLEFAESHDKLFGIKSDLYDLLVKYHD